MGVREGGWGKGDWRADCWAGMRLKPLYRRCGRVGGAAGVGGLWLGSLRRSRLIRLCCAHPRADSVAWNPHKLLAAGLQCSALLLRDTSVGLPCPCPHPTSHPGPLSSSLSHVREGRGLAVSFSLSRLKLSSFDHLNPLQCFPTPAPTAAHLHAKENVSSLRL